MSPRKVLLALFGAIGLSGLAAGEPPVNPLVEGRESNPVAREFHQIETPIGGYVDGLEGSEQPCPNVWFVLTAFVWEQLLDRLTFPLGTSVLRDDAIGV